jgi:hypothetical protein
VSDLLHLLPPIKRARAYYLYDFKGRRYLDLYQQNGRALLGHRPQGLTRVLKQVASKGLIADLPSIYLNRLHKLLKKLLAAYQYFRVVSCMHRAVELASLYLNKNIDASMIRDPVDNDQIKGEQTLSYWRPFCAPPKGAQVVLPVLPLAVSGAPVIICFKQKPPADFPPSDIISPLLLAVLIRSGYDLLQYKKAEWYNEELLQTAAGWKQQGIYITVKCKPEAYEHVFQSFLEQGVVLSPFYPGPSILPREVSEGELKKMLKLFHEIPGE